jgi:curved DNA-binding protein CbpA
VKRLSEQSLYEILEVPPNAVAAEIESAYARARDLYGPGSLATYSLMAPEEAVALGERIEEAKRVLLDPEARLRYDAALAAAAGATEAAVRIAATGTGAVASGLQRPYLVAPARTPSPTSRTTESRRADEAAADRREERREEAADHGQPSPGVDPAPPIDPTPPAARVPIQLKKEVQPEPQPEPQGREMPVPEGAVWTGEALRRVRESRGFSVRELCERTKITRHHLENIEADRFTLLPAPVYLRGILLVVARELRLDGQKVARSYLDRMAVGTPKPR